MAGELRRLIRRGKWEESLARLDRNDIPAQDLQGPQDGEVSSLSRIHDRLWIVKRIVHLFEHIHA